MSPGRWHCRVGFPSGLPPQGALQPSQGCLLAHAARPRGVSHLSSWGMFLNRACSDAPSRDCRWLSWEQPGRVSLGHPTAHLGASGLSLPCCCSRDPPARSRAAEGGRTLVAAVLLGSSSLGQEIIQDCPIDVPYLSHSVQSQQ